MSNSSTPATAERTLPRILWIVAAIILIVAAFPLPYGFYTFTRIVTCMACAVLAHSAYTSVSQRVIWACIFALLAVLFNPVIPIYLAKKIWVILDLGAVAIILAHLVFVRGIKA